MFLNESVISGAWQVFRAVKDQWEWEEFKDYQWVKDIIEFLNSLHEAFLTWTIYDTLIHIELYNTVICVLFTYIHFCVLAGRKRITRKIRLRWFTGTYILSIRYVINNKIIIYYLGSSRLSWTSRCSGISRFVNIIWTYIIEFQTCK